MALLLRLGHPLQHADLVHGEAWEQRLLFAEKVAQLLVPEMDLTVA